MVARLTEPEKIFALWDELSTQEQNTLMMELKKQHPGGFTRDDFLQFLKLTMTRYQNRREK